MGAPFLQTASHDAVFMLSPVYLDGMLPRILTGNDRPLLENKSTIGHPRMEDVARAEYELFDTRRKKYETEQADAQDLEELKQLEHAIKQEHGK